MTVTEEDMEVLVHCGVHGRVAVSLARIAECRDVDLWISCGGQQVNCGSILEVLGLALVHGSKISVCARGLNAGHALADVRKLLMEEGPL